MANKVPLKAGYSGSDPVAIRELESGDTINPSWIDAATTSAAGVSELAIASEVNAGNDATRAVTPDALAGSNLGIKQMVFCLNGSTALTTDNVAYARVPASMAGMNLVAVTGSVGTGAAGASSSGLPTFTVKNGATSMLTTNLTIDASAYTSATATTPAVIDTDNDDVATDDLIEVACTVAGTGTTYAVVTLNFQLP